MSAGNQIEKPRFFIDLLNYQYNIGNVGTASSQNWGTANQMGEMHPHTIGFNATKPYVRSSIAHNATYAYFKVGFKNPISIQDRPMFVGIFGHDWASRGFRISTRFHTGGDDWNSPSGANVTQVQVDIEDIVNGGGGADVSPEYDGWSLYKFTPSVTEGITAVVIKIMDMNGSIPGINFFKLGSFCVGYIYEPEFNADLGVSQTRIMDGIKNKNTKGGKTYSVINYLRPSNWWTGSPFELTNPDLISEPVAFNNARIGRRSWDVGFSQLSDRKYTDGVPNGVFPANEMVGRHLPDTVNGNYSSDQDYDSETRKFNYNINNDVSLYSTVYHHTLGGTIPFLFSPSSDNSPQNFAVCRFAKPGFKVTEKSYKRLNIKMKINESW